MSDSFNKIFAARYRIPQESETYKPLVMSPKLCMGFSVIQRDGTMSSFLYHSLDNLVAYPATDGKELLAFTHRGTAVTIHGTKLRQVLRAILAHTLQEIWEEDGRPLPEEEGLPTIEQVAVTHLNMLPEMQGTIQR